MPINKTSGVQPIYSTSIVKFDADGNSVIPYDAGATLKVYFLKSSDVANPNSQVLPKHEAYLAKDGGVYAADEIQGIIRVQTSYALASTSNLININFEMTEDPNARADGASLSFFPAKPLKNPFTKLSCQREEIIKIARPCRQKAKSLYGACGAYSKITFGIKPN